jgi:hypothetical protein
MKMTPALLLLLSSSMKEATATSTRENLEHMRATFNNIESAQSPPSFTKQREASGDVGFERDMPEIMNFVRPGFLKGTPIALADGSAKPIGQINYEDKLLVPYGILTPKILMKPSLF